MTAATTFEVVDRTTGEVIATGATRFDARIAAGYARGAWKSGWTTRPVYAA